MSRKLSKRVPKIVSYKISKCKKKFRMFTETSDPLHIMKARPYETKIICFRVNF